MKTQKSTTAFTKAVLTGVFTSMVFFMFSQEASPKNKTLWGGFGYFAMSGEQLNLNALNKSLAANGYEQLNSTTGSLGGGGAFAIRNFIIGGGGAWLIGSGNQNANNAVNIKGGYGFFHAGYILYSGKHGVLYPTLGIGGGGYDISVSKANSSPDFNQQLSSPAGMLTTQAGGLMTNVQISYQYFFYKSALEGFYIGVKAGYKYSPIDWKISVNNKELNNAPKINMNGLFVTIYIGGGSLIKN